MGDRLLWETGMLLAVFMSKVAIHIYVYIIFKAFWLMFIFSQFVNIGGTISQRQV